MVRWLGVLGLVLALACAGGGEEPAAPQPDAPAPTPAPGAEPAPAPTDAIAAWPLVTLGTVPGGRAVPLPAGHRLYDLDVDPRGRFAVVVTGDDTTRAAWTWDFARPLVPVAVNGVNEVAFSVFDDTVYLLASDAGKWTITRGALTAEGAWAPGGQVYASDAKLSALIAPFVRWDDAERVFFAREHAPGRGQIVAVRRSGEAAYEVTSPSGALGAVTAEAVRTPPDEWRQAPIPLQADAAVPLSLHPATGALLWKDGGGAVHARAWDAGGANWGADAVVAPGGSQVWSPNGYYAVVWEAGTAGVRLRDPAGGEVAVPGPIFRAPPVSAENGRTLVGWTDAGVETVAVTAPLAPVRYLTAGAATPGEVAALGRSGLHVSDTRGEQLYNVYDDLLYAAPSRPVFASVDGMLEVLHVGFQAVFVRVERDVSRPRLEAFLTALETAAGREDQRRVREIASGAKRMLHGDYAFPEGQKALEEITMESELHRGQVAFGDFHPRGPYATSPELSNYFRAFKYIDLLKLDEEERVMLSGDAALVSAWRAWIETQSPFLSGTRYEGLFGDGWAKTPYARPDCRPKRIAENPRRVFPLSWGRDSEILERVTAHDDLPAPCTVPERVVPSGLDLLTAFGSDGALAVQRAEYARYPALADVHTDLRGRFGAPIESDRFVDGWLRLVQILGNDAHTPEGVDGERWRRRLWETALASWTSFRHTTVLVNETSAAQMGDGAGDGFEWLSTEPVRGVVDPVPAAWAQLAGLLDTLAGHAQTGADTSRVPSVLAEGATNARRLGTLAEKQMRGEPLTSEDYDFVASFAGVIEHPYLLLAAAAAGKEMEISAPDPMMRIVDVHVWNDPAGPTVFWHAAVGRPRRVVALLGDRGLLLPGYGAVYAYHEVVSGAPMDDAKWRAEVDTTARPAWANRSDE